MSRLVRAKNVQRSEPIAVPDLCLIPFVSPTRHLLFHIMPLAGEHEWCWKKHVKNICDSLSQFNGKRIVSIATPGGGDRKPYSCPDDVIKEFELHGATDIDFMLFRNKKSLREVVSFLPMLQKVQSLNPSEVVFYGHCKGITHKQDSMCHVWSDAMYETVLNNWQQVELALQHYGIAGSFKSYGEFKRKNNHRWHYSGTFYWFRSASAFARNWQDVEQFFFGVESWPGLLFKPQEAACLFWDIPHTLPIGVMYNMCQSKHEARMQEWRHSKLEGKVMFDKNPEQYLIHLKTLGVPSIF